MLNTLSLELDAKKQIEWDGFLIEAEIWIIKE